MTNKILSTLIESGKKALIANKLVQLQYQSSKNEITNRKFEIQSIDISKKAHNNQLDLILTGHCFLRDSKRSFKLSNIKKIIDLSTGEVFHQCENFLNLLEIKELVESEVDFIDGDALYNYYFDEKDEKIYSVYEEAVITELNKLFSQLTYWNVHVDDNPPVIIVYSPELEEIEKKSLVKIIEISKISNTSFQLICENHQTNQKEWISFEEIINLHDMNNEKLNAGVYFIELIKNSKYFITHSKLKSYSEALDILIYFFRTKGRLTGKDREHIIRYFVTIEESIDANILGKEIKARKVSKSAYERSFKSIHNDHSRITSLIKFLDQTLSENEKEIQAIQEAFIVLNSKG